MERNRAYGRLRYATDEDFREKRLAEGKLPEVKERKRLTALKSSRKKRAEDPEGYRAKKARGMRELRVKNPEFAQAQNKNTKGWAKRNPGAVKVGKLARRAREIGAAGAFTQAEWHALLESFANTCPRCGRSDEPLTADHIVPLACGGSNDISNIQPLCRLCNCKKGTKTVRYNPWPTEGNE